MKTQSWRIARSLTKPRSVRRSKQTTKCGEFSRTCRRNAECSSTVTISARECNRWMMRKQPFWQPKGNSFRCKARLEKQKNYLERVSEEIEVWKSGSRLTRNWKQPAPNSGDRTNCRKRQSCQSRSSSGSDTHDRIHSRPSSRTNHSPLFKSVLSMQNVECHSVSEQLMAAGATDGDVKKISQIMAQTVRPPEPGLEAHSLRAKWRVWMKSSPLASAYLDSAKWTSRVKKPSRGACQTRSQKRDDWRRNANQRVKGCVLLRLWFYTQLTPEPEGDCVHTLNSFVTIPIFFQDGEQCDESPAWFGTAADM